ncbi:MAG: hypothetical protein J1F68_01105 [Clostridiales bacterium]|nr:hypothetical protein [Clostridiales bacterium]
MIYTLLAEFTIDWSVEWLGIIASAFILISFLFTKQVITRLINMVGCLAFVIYATVFIQSFSTAFMNGALFIVHIIFLVKDFLARQKNKNTADVNTESNEKTQGSEEQKD